MDKWQLNNQTGFTLMEVLVTVGVFAIAMTIASAIFINVNNLQQQTENLAKLQNEGRYILEKTAREVRGRELDYSRIVIDTDGLTDHLYFKEDEFGESYQLFFDTDTIKITTVNGIEQTADLNSSEVAVERLKFALTPETDQQLQPRVTIILVIKNKNVSEKYRKTLTLQTTISSKIYR